MFEVIKRNKINLILVLIFLVLPWFFFNDSIQIRSVIFGHGDPNYNTIPLWDLIQSSIKGGEFPFWNKYIFSGFPFFANPQTNILYPLTLFLLLIFPVTIAYNLTILIHYSLAGIFMYLFLDRYKLDKLASFAGGLTFMFSGVMICHKGHSQMLFVIVWVPLILYFLDKFRATKKFRFVLIAAVFLAVSFFGGHPQMFVYGSMVILLYIFYFSLVRVKKNLFFLFSLTIFFITFLLIAVQLFPMIELTKNSIRSSIDYGIFTFFSYPFRLIPTFFVPFIYGAGTSGVGFFGSLSYIETVAYFGITTIPFFILGFFSKNKEKYFWIFILVFSFLLVLGENTPLYELMFKIPLYNLFRIPTRNWFEFGLAFSIISGFGFNYLIKNQSPKLRKIVITTISLLAAFSIGFVLLNPILDKIKMSEVLNRFLFVKNNLVSLLETTKLTNLAILVPLILIIILTILLVITLFKKKKFLYVFFIVLIFLDLRFVGNYVEGSSDSSYVYKDISKVTEYSFLKDEVEPFRFYPVVDWGPEGCTIYPKRNIHYGIDVISGNDPLILGQYNHITGSYYMENKEVAEALMKNNNILSMLNTKFISYFKPEDYQTFNNNISKTFYEKKEALAINYNEDSIELQNSRIDTSRSIIFTDSPGGLKLFSVPIEIDSGRDYLISFEIQELSDVLESQINNEIHIDFYGDNYDYPEQEFTVNPEDVSKDIKTIRKTISSNEVPEESDIFLRIFTYSNGSIRINNLEVNDVRIIENNNYDIIYNEDIIILQNLKSNPRFHLANHLIEVNNTDEAKDILLEKDVVWYEDRFDPENEITIEGWSSPKKTFNSQDTKIDVIDYQNNYVKLKSSSISESFLVFSDTFYPGWKAFIDGKEIKIYKTNGILKGIEVPQGNHEILFKFLPDKFYLYLAISLTSCICIVFFLIYSRFKHSRKHK